MTNDRPAATSATAADDPDSRTPDVLRRAAERAIDYRASLPASPRRRHAGSRGRSSPAGARRPAAAPRHRPADRHRRPGGWRRARARRDERTALLRVRIGGSHPAALAADWLTSVWDQNAVLYLASPAAAVVEEVAAAWLVELLGLPADTSVGFTTSATLANFAGLAAARHAVLRRVGWDVEEDGLVGAPPIRVIVGADAHASLLLALRYVGLGRGRAERIPTDDEGRMDAGALADALRDRSEPTIVCAQLGEVNTGAFDPIGRVVAAVRAHPNAWVHVDGAFGLWAAASPRLRHLVDGFDVADSWATDAHKWLNVPYDSGLVFVRDGAAHRAATSASAAYLPPAPGQQRDPMDWVPEMSRRARGFAIYAVIRELGADGIAALVERSSDLARRMARRLAADPRSESSTRWC